MCRIVLIFTVYALRTLPYMSNIKDYSGMIIPFAGYKVCTEVMNNACEAILDDILGEQVDF
jgi:hypothetical protein